MTTTNEEGIGNPIRIRNGKLFGARGTFWAWPIDGYYDLHFTDIGVDPDGSDVVEECFPTLKAVRIEVRELNNLFH
jgi:hypothetical protein